MPLYFQAFLPGEPVGEMTTIDGMPARLARCKANKYGNCGK